MQIGFLPIRIWDLLDVLIVGYLMYRMYKLLRGNIAFNIFVGLALLMVVYWLVDLLGMSLLSKLLNALVATGVVIVVVIFQPEIRRFLLMIGDSALKQRSNFWDRILPGETTQDTSEQQKYVQAIKAAMLRMSKTATGALIVLASDLNIELISNAGTELNADISQHLLESLFNKESPLHDGAVIISNDKVHAAGVVLPVSDSSKLSKRVGLRHRAAVGVTEKANIAAFIVSEETGSISYAFRGKLYRGLSEEQLLDALNKYYD